MQDFLSGETVNLTFNYGDGHEPKIPDVGSVTYTVIDHSGNPIVGLQNIPITTTAATFKSTIVIPAINNSVDPTKSFERRTIFVRYQVGGNSFYQKIFYRLVPTMTYTTTPAFIRAFLGVNKDELPDEDIDLLSAYIYVREAFNVPSVFTDALISGDRLEIVANEAIAMRAAIDLIPSLQNRITQSEKNGVMGFTRAKITDFSDLLAEAYRRYHAALLLLDGGTGAEDYVLIVVTQDVDPITAGT